MAGLLDLPPILGVRKSFRWKILLTLLGPVALIAVITIIRTLRQYTPFPPFS